jgi:hypothetical protein
MNPKSIAGILLSLVFLTLTSSFATESSVKKSSPVGSWTYSVPGVPEGYETGTMIISEEGKVLKVTLKLNDYYSVEAEKIVYQKKDLSFSVWVESEEILIAGTFDKDTFKAIVSYFEGDFELTATRVPSE